MALTTTKPLTYPLTKRQSADFARLGFVSQVLFIRTLLTNKGHDLERYTVTHFDFTPGTIFVPLR